MMLAALLAGCRQEPKPERQAPVRPPGLAAGCNVLLLTLDTTRADRLGCYGYERAKTRELDALARSGVRFEQAFAQAPITLPSHVVLMTGTYPPENGVRDNQRYALGPELPTLAEAFQTHGYRTAAFIAARILASRHGLNRGFDVYDEDMERFERRADAVTDAAIAWLAQPSDRPFFVWAHYYDPHWPYDPPPEYLHAAGDPYDGEIAFMDAQIGRLIAWLRLKNLLSKTLIIAVGDHGESLGEHGYDWHALLVYESILRVPLLFALPGRLPEGVAFDDIVSLADIAPTVLDLLGWEIPKEVSGRSLTPLFKHEPLPARASYGESDFPYENFGWAKLRSWTVPDWKYIRAPRPELYDRRNDRGELHDLSETHPDVLARLEGELAAFESGLTQRQSRLVAVDSASLEALRSLGYVGGPAPAGRDVENLRDPKDVVDIANIHRIAQALVRTEPRKTIEYMEPAVRRSPESFVLVELLAQGYAHAGLLELAELTMLDALSLQPAAVEAWLFLAEIRRNRRAIPAAMEACQQALELDPHNASARELAASLERELSEQRQRIAELRQRYQAEPDAAEFALRLGLELAAAGDTGAAIELLREALKRHPDDAALANALAWYLATSPQDALRNGAEAVRWAEVATRSEGLARFAALDTLAAAQAESGDFASAVETARRAAQMAEQAGEKDVLRLLERRLRFYEQGRPFRSPS